MTHKSRVAVIGTGNIGATIAGNLVKANRSFIIADRKIEKAMALSQKLGNLSQPIRRSDSYYYRPVLAFENAILELPHSAAL